MSNDPNESTTKYGTTLDGVFFRYLNKFESKVFITYFSFRKPIVSFLEYNSNKEVQSEQNSANSFTNIIIYFATNITL